MSRKIEILVLPGDGIGPEVMSQALRVLHRISDMADLSLVIHEDLIHGQAWDAYGTFCRDETVHQAKNVDAVLVGAVGGAIVYFSILFLEKKGIDDPVGAISAHGIVGIYAPRSSFD